MASSGGDLIKQLRTECDFSQEDLAEAVGVSNGAVGQWETGRTSPRRAMAMKVDRVLEGGGRVLAAYGYAPISRPDDPEGGWAPLELVVQLQKKVNDLAARVEELDAEVGRLKRANGRGAQ